MKDKQRISANEINRFVYCPYQWYYKRTYGNKELTRRYEALGLSSSKHESFYAKGSKHHSAYYFKYKLKRMAQWGVAILLVAIAIKVVIG